MEEIHSLTNRFRVLGLPFIRGIIALFELFYIGVKGLYFSANAALEEEEETFSSKELAIALILALMMSSLFIVIPFFLTTWIGLSGMLFNAVESIIRLSIFVIYITLISMWSEFKRILQYHGAEHKTINAYESGSALNVLNVKKFSRLNPRCGTSFLVIVLILSVIFYSILPEMGFIERLSYRLILFPVIGSISYEVLKLSDKYRNSIFMKILTIPGLAFQHLTTREPDDDMIEVAVRAVEEACRLKNS
jgi:uncharacterized protein YqhQ